MVRNGFRPPWTEGVTGQAWRESDSGDQRHWLWCGAKRLEGRETLSRLSARLTPARFSHRRALIFARKLLVIRVQAARTLTRQLNYWSPESRRRPSLDSFGLNHLLRPENAVHEHGVVQSKASKQGPPPACQSQVSCWFPIWLCPKLRGQSQASILLLSDALGFLFFVVVPTRGDYG